jgi:hypothetical protein
VPLVSATALAVGGNNGCLLREWKLCAGRMYGGLEYLRRFSFSYQYFPRDKTVNKLYKLYFRIILSPLSLLWKMLGGLLDLAVHIYRMYPFVSVHLCVSVRVSSSFVYPFVSVCLSVYPFVSVHPRVSVRVCPSMCIRSSVYIFVSVHLCLSVCICPSLYTSPFLLGRF